MNKTLNAAYAIESTPVQLTERDAVNWKTDASIGGTSSMPHA